MTYWEGNQLLDASDTFSPVSFAFVMVVQESLLIRASMLNHGFRLVDAALR